MQIKAFYLIWVADGESLGVDTLKKEKKWKNENESQYNHG
jgi:hypothetical protein